MESNTPFIGELQGSSHEKVSVLKDLADRTPVFIHALEAMKQAGIRDHQTKSIEKNSEGRVEIIERNFRGASEHGMAVALGADSLSEIIGLTPESRELLVSAALFHDVTKKTEIVLNGFRSLVQEERVSDEAKDVLKETLESVGALGAQTLDSHIEKISQPSTKSYLDYFRKDVDEPFLHSALEKTAFSTEEQKQVAEIAMSDTITSIARLGVVLQDKGIQGEELEQFWQIHKNIASTFGLESPSIDDPSTLLGPVHLYCDDIARGSRLVSLDERMDALKSGGGYVEMDEWAKSVSGGLSYFDVERVLGHATEAVIKDMGIKNGMISSDSNPTEIPSLIMQNLQKRISSHE